jgi:thymidylate synthase (FAD)
MIGSGAEAQMVRRCLLLTEPGLRRDGLRARHERVAPPSTAGQGRSQARGGPLGVLRPPPRQLGGAAACRPLHRPARAGLETPLAAPSAVVALRYVGVRQTYDLSVAGRWHNFLANGIVVHNSFNEFSLRYAKASDDFYVPAAADVRTQVGKPGAYSFEPVEAALAEHTRARLQALYEEAFATYEELVEAGVARELARSVLPVGAYTQFYWTVNARALMNFVSLRNSEFAQLEIRRYAEAVEQCFAEQMPVTHAAFVANGRVAP